ATFAMIVWDSRALGHYPASDNFFTYDQFSPGFKGCGVQPWLIIPSQVAPFVEDEPYAYDMGLWSYFLARPVGLIVTAFIDDSTLLQIQMTTPFFNVPLPVQPDPALPNYTPVGGAAPAALFLNAGDVRQKGVEAELSATPVDGFDINASLSYLD